MRIAYLSGLVVVLSLQLAAQPAPPAQTYVGAIGRSPLKAPATADFAPASAFTMEAWVFRTGTTPYAWLMGKGLATAGVDPFVSFALLLDDGGTKIRLTTSTGQTGSARDLTAPTALPLNTWTHVAAVLDGTTTTLLVNGAVVATGSSVGTPLSAPTLPLGVGVAFLANGNTNYPAWPGYARQVRFWNVARTAAQVAAAIGETLPASRSGLVSAWPLDEVNGTSARDLSGAGRSLTPANGTLATLRTSIVAVGPFYTATETTVSDNSLAALNDGQLVDFDSDGDLDLVLVQVSSPPTVPETRTRLRAFRNNQGTFVDATDAVLGNGTMVHPRHNAVADFNGDGRVDLLVVGHGTDTPPFPGEQAKLLIQSADGRLVDESATRLPAHSSFTHNLAIGDIDGDSDLDIYLANVNGGDSGPRFYLNNGAGVFTEVTDRLPGDIANRTGGLNFTSSCLVDVTGDSRPDLVLGAGDSPINELLVNDGTGRFARDSRYTLPPKIIDEHSTTVAISTADFNADGLPDLVLSTTGGSETLPDGRTIYGYGKPGLQLLLGRGDGTFYDATAQAGFTWSTGERWVVWPRLLDLNGDSRPDILAQVSTASGVVMRQWVNAGAGRFIDTSDAYGAGSTSVVLGGDFDRDGKVDLLFARGNGITVARAVKSLDLAAFQLAAPTFTTQPKSQGLAAGGSITLQAATSAPPGTTAATYQWQFNGTNLAGATADSLTLANLQPANTALYTLVATSDAATTSSPAIVGLTISDKVSGAGAVVGNDIVHANGNIFDQVLLNGAAEAITADPGQATRTSFVDLDDDIVQVEFSGPGTLSLVLEGAANPAPPTKYNQAVNYVKGHAGIVITGATEQTNVSVFTVGRVTAVNQALFKDNVSYDGFADIAFVAIQSSNGRFGGVRTANTTYLADKGFTGLYAPGVTFEGPVYLGDITAFDTATPVLVLGRANGNTWITGGDLQQNNVQPVQVAGLTQLAFKNGSDSHGNLLPASKNKARLLQNGTDITAQIVVNP